MNIFIIIEILLFLLFWRANPYQKSYFYVSIGLLFLIVGFYAGEKNATNELIDYYHYVNFFLGKPSMYGSYSNYTLEWPYYYYCKILHSIAPYRFAYVFTYALLVVVPFAIIIKRYSRNVALSVFLIFTYCRGSLFVYYISVHRQMLATALLMIAFIIYESNVRYKAWIAVLIILVSLASHSSSYFFIPIIGCLYFFRGKKISFKTMFISVAATLFLGVYIENNLNVLIYDFIAQFDDVDNVQRSTYYYISDVYQKSEVKILNLLPYSLFSIFLFFISDENERNSFFTKCLFYSTCIYNLFSFLPLIDRSMTVFVLFAAAGSIPSCVNDDRRPVKKVMLFFMVLFMYYVFKVYTMGNYLLLPFKFIWE